jgi:4a-hydroxytetrahydrobiopterin dehydratase
MTELAAKRCIPCEGGTPRIEPDRARDMLSQLDGWALNGAATELSHDFKFRNYYETMAFVNAVAFMAHQEDHHPDMEVGWGHCLVRYTTHAIAGLSENDFICAAKIDTLLAPPQGPQGCAVR